MTSALDSPEEPGADGGLGGGGAGCGAHAPLLVPWGSFGKKTEVCGVRGLALLGRGREKH